MMNFRQGSKEFIPIFQVDSAVFHLCKKALDCFMKISIMCRTEGACIKHDRNLRHLVKLMPGFQARKISSFMSKGGGIPKGEYYDHAWCRASKATIPEESREGNPIWVLLLDSSLICKMCYKIMAEVKPTLPCWLCYKRHSVVINQPRAALLRKKIARVISHMRNVS